MVFAVAWFAAVARAEEPIEMVHGSLEVPKGLDPQVALSAIDDVAQIFTYYEPIVPRFPGVNLELTKVIRSQAPPVLEIPVSGRAVGFQVHETAHVEVTSLPASCATPGVIDGRKVVLDFGASTYNIERRIDRIEILACLEDTAGGGHRVDAVGRMYAGYKPEDPEKNMLNEKLGAKAFQIAFIQQVSAILDAVRRVWDSRPA